MRRRELIIGLGGVVAGWPLGAGAQQGGKVHRVGLIFSNSPVSEMVGPDPIHPLARTFVHALRALGYVEGQNLTFEHRSAEGRFERFGEIVAELVGRKVDVIVTVSSMANEAKRVTHAVPIVMATSVDPVRDGIVASLARPGGNVTGFTNNAGPEIEAKQLQLLKEAVPAVRRVALFHNPESTLHANYRREIEAAAARLGLELARVDLRTEQDVDVAFAAVARHKVEALLILGQPFVFRVGERIAQLALERRLPVISPILEMAHAGALMAYGSRLVDDVARVPYYLDRILKGTRPQDMPVEQASRFYLVVNRATARGLGIVLPHGVLARADEVVG